MKSYSELIDDIMLHFSEGSYQAEVANAKTEFFKAVGLFDEESQELEMKISLFVEWFIFSRPLSDNRQKPIDLVLTGKLFPISSQEKPFYLSLQSHRHSLFEFLKVKDDDVHIRDLFSDYKLILKKSSVALGFSKQEIFETRLFPHEDSFVFSRAFCIHPSEATSYIRKEIKKVKKLKEDDHFQAREELMFRLLKMRYKIEQYKHVKLKDIYTNDSKLRL